MKQPKLILNFDINKTIILTDTGKNTSIEENLKSICIDLCWGIINDKKEFEIKYNKFSIEKPKEGLINYYTYLNRYYLPKKTKNEIKDDQERYSFNNQIKNQQQKLTNVFFDKGQIGEIFNEQFLQCYNKIKVPEEQLKKIDSNPVIKKLYKDGYYFIFLSFYFLIIELTEQKRDFSIILRTFGSDAPLVISEFNEFCKGNHPLFDGEIFPKYYFDGTHNSKNLLFNEENMGIYYRFGSEVKDCYLVLNECNRINNLTKDQLCENYKNCQNKIIIGEKIYDFLKETIYKGKINCFVIRDDYFNWSINEERAKCSKLMMIDPKDFDYHSIFFDDNVKENNEFSIVDCKDINSGETMKYNEIKNKFVIKSHCVLSIKDQKYFIDLIKEAEKLRLKDLDNLLK